MRSSDAFACNQGPLPSASRTVTAGRKVKAEHSGCAFTFTLRPAVTECGNQTARDLTDTRIVSQKLVNPLRHGTVVEWDSVEAILEYLFVKEMKIPSEEHAVLLSDPPLSPSTNREKYAEMMFETFECPSFPNSQSVKSINVLIRKDIRTCC
ncbi:unnamed protein product [Ranitomeya imitator]|uniref:Uncharacterized protein n=1 Tax=Ranitomeya imitator TaxID=111125 RepID=A0ABN9M1E0_9NEOB|nr:unnamed protein product [Ranitomeya imitator]